MSIWLALLVMFIAFVVMSEIVDKYFIKSLDNISKWLNLSDDVAGATLLAFGTSAPEMATTLVALFIATGSSAAVGVGNIVGSAIFQILVVIGFAAAVRSSKLQWQAVLRDSLFYAFSILLLIFFVQDNQLTAWEAGGLVSTYVIYLVLLLNWKYLLPASAKTSSTEEEVSEKNNQDSAETTSTNPLLQLFTYLTWPLSKLLSIIPDAHKRPNWTLPVFFLSLGIIGYACYWLVEAAQDFAQILNIDPSIIALTILAGGSSIPEMVSSAIVSKQGRGGMAIANAIGSNIFDILMSLGFPVLFFTLINGNLQGIGGANITSSVILLFVTLVATISLLAAQKFHATRPFGIFLIAVYIVYVWAAYTGVI